MRFNPSYIDRSEVDESVPTDAPELPSEGDLADRFRTAFRGYPAGVAIITTTRPSGPVGVLVSSLASVSAVPPIIALSISDASNAGQALLQGVEVQVHMLTRDDIELARHFSRRNRQPGEDDPFWVDREGSATLSAHGAVLHGCISRRARAGSATLITVDVDRIDLGDPDVERPSGLIHYDRQLHVVERPENRG